MTKQLLVLFAALALSAATACGTTTEEGENGGSPAAQLARELGNLDQLAGQVLEGNEEAYDGIAFAAASLQSAIGGAVTSEALRIKQNGDSCIPAELQGTAYAYDPPSGTYRSESFPNAPEGGLSVFVYEIDGGAPMGERIGTLDVTCSGALTNPTLGASLVVDGVEVLNLSATGSFALDSYDLSVSGFLASADGSQRVNYGERQSSGGYMYGTSSTFGVTFSVGEDTYATLTRNTDPVLGEDSAFLTVYREDEDFYTVFNFTANLMASNGTMSGSAYFETNANPFNPDPMENYYTYHQVACFDGAFDNMTVTRASSCLIDPQLGHIDLEEGQLRAIADGYHGLQGMYSAVQGVSAAGASVVMAALAELSQMTQ